jgi:tetratricopeptide (TPR) repeat protein
MQTIKKKGLTAKKQQPEEEIRSLAHNASSFISTYKKQFTMLLFLIAAMVMFAVGYAIRHSQQEQKAAPLVVQAYEQYSPSNGAPADFRKALDLFQAIQKEFSSTMSGAIAQYYVGNCLANLGQAEEAIKEYQGFVKQYSGEKFILGLVYQRLGYTYLGLGRQAEAVKAFEQAEAATGPGIPTIELARLYEATGNLPESQKKYKLIVDKLSGTTWGMEAMGKVQKIAPTQPLGTEKERK